MNHKEFGGNYLAIVDALLIKDPSDPASQLQKLFAETLLWQRLSLPPFTLEVSVRDKGSDQEGRKEPLTLTFHSIARAAGIPVFLVIWPYPELPNLTCRRAVYRALSPSHAQHLLCYVTRDAKQVAFVWAKRRQDKKTELRVLPYYAGSHARTTIEQLAKLAFSIGEVETLALPNVIERLDDVFSVEAVTDRFFADYQRVFSELESILRAQRCDFQWAHDYALQFLNRLIFLYFIQRKRFSDGEYWLGNDPNFIATFWQAYKKSSHDAKSQGGAQAHESGVAEGTFFEHWLKVLFFEAFNNKFHGGYRHFPPDIASALQTAPYLNGGLFSKNELDEKYPVIIPDRFFRLLFDEFDGTTPGFLERYNFTVSESTPLDIEVAVDPEMIGKVYESLVNITAEGVALEEDRRGSAGIFYTPRVEIDLMCRLSLVDALSNHIGPEHRELLYDWVFATDPEEKEAADEAVTAQCLWEKLKVAVKNLTVCDPACGSGSFLVGMLLVLDDLQERINFHLDIHESVYDRRRRIIGDQLYGVDVMNWAVHVAELRLWLQLTVETDLKKAEAHLKPLLPNLTFKIRCGDSLVQEIGGINFGLHRSSLAIPSGLNGKIAELKNEKKEYYQGQSHLSAQDIRRKEIQLFREILEERIHRLENELKYITEALNRPDHIQNDFLGGPSMAHQGIASRKQLEHRHDTLKAELDRVKSALVALKSNEDVPFVWDIAFVEIFESTDRGFDIVIGNPPYVRKERIAPPNLDPKDFGGENSDRWREIKRTYKCKLQEAVAAAHPRFFGNQPGKKTQRKLNAKSDLYVYFYFYGLSLVNPKGSFCFITSNSWLDVGYGKDLQEFLLLCSHLKFVIDNQLKRSFKQADINTVIVLLGPARDTAPPEVSTQELEAKLVRFVLFKRPFEDVLRAEVFKDIERATQRSQCDEYRLNVVSHAELLAAGTVPDEDDSSGTAPPPCSGKSASTKPSGPHIKIVRYLGDKWGGKYLRAPDIYIQIIARCQRHFQRLDSLCMIEGYIHDNSTGPQYTQYPFIKSIKDVKKVWLDRNSPGVKLFGVRDANNAMHRARILFPRTFFQRHLVLWNPEGVLGKEFYKIVSRDSNVELELSIAAQLNSTFGILQREIIGVTNFGGGAIKFSGEDIGLFLVVPHFAPTELLKETFRRFAQRESLMLPDELYQHDRRKLDALLFNYLGLSDDERHAIYDAVYHLIDTRVRKASGKNVMGYAERE